jgi:CRP-like cAMP-binding protein
MPRHCWPRGRLSGHKAPPTFEPGQLSFPSVGYGGSDILQSALELAAGTGVYFLRTPRPMSQPSAATANSLTELGTVLNAASLRLSPDVRAVQKGTDRVILKYQPGRTYLVVTSAQWAVLQEFSPARTAPDVLRSLMAGQRCPPLREFYELLIKAVRGGMLQADGLPVPAAVIPSRWPLKIPGALVRWATLLALVAVAVVFFLKPGAPAADLRWLALGWGAAIVATSLGAMIAASVVRSAGADVYRLRLVWLSLVPRLHADLGDAILAGRRAGMDAAIAQIFPLVAAVAAAVWWSDGLVLPLLVVLLWQLSPLWPSPMRDFLAAGYREPELATTYNLVLAREHLFSFLARARQHLPGRRYFAACAVATIIWLVLVLSVGAWRLQASGLERLEQFAEAGGWRHAALVAGGLAALLVLGAVGLVVWIVVGHVRAWLRARAERQLRPAAVLVSAETIADWLGRTILLRDLPAADLQALAAAVKPEEHKRGSIVVKEGDPGERLYVVISGRLDVRRNVAKNRTESVAELGEGDFFGEIALLHGGIRTRTVRALERSVLLGLDRADFERLILSRMSRQAVEDAVQKSGFLQHLPLTRNWSQTALAAFAQRAKLQEVPEGTAVLKEGTRNLWFYLVHRGELVVRQGERELRRLKAGDSFGELSLFGDGSVTATVVVTSSQASLLVISGSDFLHFITHDFMIALDWEDSRRRRIDSGDGRERD